MDDLLKSDEGKNDLAKFMDKSVEIDDELEEEYMAGCTANVVLIT